VQESEAGVEAGEEEDEEDEEMLVTGEQAGIPVVEYIPVPLKEVGRRCQGDIMCT
jgi:hypothetical protein